MATLTDEEQGHLRGEQKKGSVLAVDAVDSGSDKLGSINSVIRSDQQHDKKAMSWQKAAWLMSGEQVGLSIMAQSWSLAVLGWVPGTLVMVIQGILFYITSMTMHKFIMKHPKIRDICDFAYCIFGGSNVAYWFCFCMVLANNILLIGFHILTGARIFNTLSDHAQCTVIFAVVVTLIGVALSIPRELAHVSKMSMVSAATMGLAILLFLVFAGIEEAPGHGPLGDYPSAGPIVTYAFPQPGTSWITCMSAVLNITFLWVPQVLFPTFISEMERPEDFPKSLAVLAGVSSIVFIIPPALGFHFIGQYATAPAFGSLSGPIFKQVSFGLVIVPTMVIGVIYANVTGKLIYHKIIGNPPHADTNTFKNWAVWIGLMASIWTAGFLFAEVVPSMGDFLSLLGAGFCSFFGFIFFAVAYWRLHKGELFDGLLRSVMTVVHVFVMIEGLMLLGPGLYVSVQQIIETYSKSVLTAFSCADVSL